MNLDQVLNSIEDKDITEIRNSLESQLNQRVDQQTNFHTNTTVANNGIFTSNSNDFSIGSNNNRIINTSSISTANNNINNSTTILSSTAPSSSSTLPVNSNRSNHHLQKQTNLLNGGGMQANESNNNNSKTFILTSTASGSNNSHIFVTTSSAGTTMPTNEPVKLVYPVSGTTTTTSGGIITTGTQLPNGTIGLSQQQQQTIGIVKGGTGQGQTQIIIKPNSGTAPPQMVTMTKTISNQTQNMVGTPTMLQPGNIQIVNVRPPNAPQTQNHQQKTVAAVQPRVVIGNPQTIIRPGGNVTLAGLQQGLQQGQPGQAILIKADNGQLQLLRIGPPTSGQVGPNLTAGSNTIRLQTVPAVSRFAGPQLALRKTGVSQAQAQQQQQQQQQQQKQQQGTIIVSSAGSGSTMTATPTVVVSSGPMTNSHINTSVASSHHITSGTMVTQHQVVQSGPGVGAAATATNRTSLDNSKEKCRKFLTNLIELSKREPKSVERNVRTLIQELVDANVEPEEFCERLERLLNASPQPCLIGFLKKSLPLLRQSLVTKEIVIEGINAPSASVAFSGSGTTITNIPAQIRPVTQVGQTQIRMITTPSGVTPGTSVPKIGQTTIRQSTPIRIQPPGMQTGPRLVTQIRPGATLVQQPASVSLQSTPPALQPVSGIQSAQMRTATTTTLQTRPQALQIRTSSTVTAPAVVRTPTQSTVTKSVAPIVRVQTSGSGVTLAPKSTNSVAAGVVNNFAGGTGSGSASLTTITNSKSNSLSQATTTTSTPSSTTTINNKTITTKMQQVQQHKQQFPKEKERKASSSAAAFATASSYMYGDDDINDVAAMGGVNLAEESQRILGSTEFIGSQMRSCKDEVFLNLPLLQSKIRAIVAKHGLEEPSNEVSVLISHATQERLKNIVEKLAVIAEHRIDIIKVDPRYEVTKDVRGQIKFLEELDKAEQKRHEEQEREMLMRAAKSRSKTEDPEHVKLKQKAKEMQRAEIEEMRQRDANLTALQAIGPRKKPRLEGDNVGSSVASSSGLGTLTKTGTPSRPRIKRVNLRDMLFYLEHEKDSCRSSMLYKAYLK